MTRISKDPELRKEEIMNISQKYFIEKGYWETKVDEIVKAINIAKGTFYYYFKSKEEILDAIIDRFIDDLVLEIKIIIENKNIPLLKRMEVSAFKELEINFKHLPGLHKIKNIDIHERVNTKLVEKYAPVMAVLIEEGIREKLFEVNYPLDIMEIFLIITHSIFDPGVFKWDKDAVNRKTSIIIGIMESVLKAKKGSFDFMYKVFGSIYGIN